MTYLAQLAEERDPTRSWTGSGNVGSPRSPSVRSRGTSQLARTSRTRPHRRRSEDPTPRSPCERRSVLQHPRPPAPHCRARLRRARHVPSAQSARTIPAEPHAPACGDGGFGGPAEQRSARSARAVGRGPPKCYATARPRPTTASRRRRRVPGSAPARPNVAPNAPSSRSRVPRPRSWEQLRDPPRGTVDRTPR